MVTDPPDALDWWCWGCARQADPRPGVKCPHCGHSAVYGPLLRKVLQHEADRHAQ